MCYVHTQMHTGWTVHSANNWSILQKVGPLNSLFITTAYYCLWGCWVSFPVQWSLYITAVIAENTSSALYLSVAMANCSIAAPRMMSYFTLFTCTWLRVNVVYSEKSELCSSALNSGLGVCYVYVKLLSRKTQNIVYIFWFDYLII